MLSKKLFMLMHKIALFAIVFASLAPSISHALATQQGINTFAQEICSSNGKKITIQVVTTKGQQLATELTDKEADNRAPTGIQHHLQHCPFCANPSTDVAIQVSHLQIVTLLATQVEKQSATTPVVLSCFYTLPPPAQAPPIL
jgi:hypothetical protein